MNTQHIMPILVEMFLDQNKYNSISSICPNINDSFRGLSFNRLTVDNNKIILKHTTVFHWEYSTYNLTCRTNGMDWRNDIMWASIDIRNFITFKDLI